MTWPTPEDLPRRGTVTAFDGRLVVDLDARVATVDGRATQLTFKETDLLHGLVELGDGTHPAEEIMRRAWEVDWPHARDLRVPIRILGNKLGEPSWIVESPRDHYGLHPTGATGNQGVCDS
ncbi:hypothetical protein ACFV4F_15065 [Kitasatospora sp. NPDC059722]|uniref:hypothetical protein n=1 Tax=Kitasatospora sp. NPDC059722 TaxID=3346925 RepID=UPI0036B4B800